MGIVITSPANANINDSTLSRSVTVSGKIQGTLLTARLRIHGTTIATGTSTGSTVSFSYTAADLYNALEGKSLTNAVTITVTETDGGFPVSDDSLTGGAVTINARYSNFGWSTTANPYNLDNPTALLATFTRPHSAFRLRLRVRVNGILCINRMGFSDASSLTWTPTQAEIDAMIAAMGGVSPRALQFEFITQFRAASIVDLHTSGSTLDRSSGVIRAFAERSTLSAFSAFTIGNALSFTIAQNTSGTTHDIVLRFGSTVILSRTNVGTGNRIITPTAAEVTAMYNATGSVTSITATLELVTRLSGTQVGSTHTRTATASVGADILPDFTGVTHQELTTSPDVASLVGAYVQGISNIGLAITGAVPGAGASLSSYRITLGTITINAVSGNTGPVPFSGTNLVCTGRVTDSRGRTREKTVNVTILPYAPPTITTMQFYRCNADGSPNQIGPNVRFQLTGHVQSLLVSTQRNRLTVRFRTKASSAGSFTTRQTIGPQTTLTFNGLSNVFTGHVITESYDGLVEIQDQFNTTIALASVSSGILMAWGKNGIGIGKIPEAGRRLDVDGDIWEDGQRLADKYGAFSALSAYPVGAIYISVAPTSPATLFGGTWQAFGAGQVMVGFNSGDSDFNAPEKTGGAKTHTLSVNEMPGHTHLQNSHNHTQNSHDHTQNSHNHTQNSHTHQQHAWNWMNDSLGSSTRIAQSSTGFFTTARMNPYNTDSATAVNQAATAVNQSTTAINQSATAVNQNTGGGATHNNLQPFITVYMWKRTA